MSDAIKSYERKRESLKAARDEARYLRELHRIATCGLPMKTVGIHYGTHEVPRSIAMRVADAYLVWAAEYEATADRLERELEDMLQ